jgi:hypothetical protein
MGVRDRLYVGKPFQRKVPLGDTRDFVAVREYLKALDGVLVGLERRKVRRHVFAKPPR